MIFTSHYKAIENRLKEIPDLRQVRRYNTKLLADRNPQGHVVNSPMAMVEFDRWEAESFPGRGYQAYGMGTVRIHIISDYRDTEANLLAHDTICKEVYCKLNGYRARMSEASGTLNDMRRLFNSLQMKVSAPPQELDRLLVTVMEFEGLMYGV